MKVRKVTVKKSEQPVRVTDCFVDNGYLQGASASLPDVDTDFEALRLQDVRKYTETRYNTPEQTRVFMAGTFTTLKLKAVLKDVCRVYRVPVNLVNYITAIFDDDAMTWTDLFKLAAGNAKVRNFIQEHPQVIEDIRTLMGQPRSSSIHASAQLITPKTKDGVMMEAFDFTPLKKIDGQLVSEFSGYDLDECGLLKNDSLSTKELSKLRQTIEICNREYNAGLTFQGIVQSGLDDEKVYDLLQKGYTQNVFQFSSKGMTKFLISMKPEKIEDLIAANALFRPATLDSGSTEKYVDCKLGDAEPVYLWGTYNAMKDTYGVLCIAKDSMVTTSDGEKPIQDVQPEDMVLTEDGTYRKVLGNWNKGIRKVVRVSTDSGKDIVCTPDHKVLTGRGWVAAKDLLPGDDAIKSFRTGCGQVTSEEPARVVSVKDAGISQVYDLSVETNHSFCVEGLVVHNCYQEQLAQIAREVGKFSLSDGVKLVKFISKKKQDKIDASKEKFMAGALSQGCPKEDADAIWNMFEVAGSYCFNKCISGKERMTETDRAEDSRPYTYMRPSCRGHKPITIADMYRTMHDEEWAIANHRKSLHARYVNYGYGTGVSMREDGGLQFNRIVDIRYMGFRILYRITLEGGATIDVTRNHKHPTDHGMKTTEMLEVGKDKMYVYDGWSGVKPATVIAVQYHGIDEVYDVEMADPYHTFMTAKGVVTCNSHATAYAVTAYAGAYLKANYPTAFYTVALQWADDDEIPTLMSEMEQCSRAKIVAPDINVSADTFITDYATDRIFWSLGRIRSLGPKATQWIMEERNARGPFTSIENFVNRVFRYRLKKYEYWDDPEDPEEAVKCPVNAAHIKHLVLAGCFDKVENVQAVIERYAVLSKAAECLGFRIRDKDIPPELRDKHYFWSQQQIAVSGLGTIDYRRIFDNCASRPQIKGKAAWALLKNIVQEEYDTKRVAVCATIADIEEKRYQDKGSGEDKVFCKMLLQQDTNLSELLIWHDEWKTMRAIVTNGGPVAAVKNRLIVCTAQVKFSNFTQTNGLQIYKSSIIEII